MMSAVFAAAVWGAAALAVTAWKTIPPAIAWFTGSDYDGWDVDGRDITQAYGSAGRPLSNRPSAHTVPQSTRAWKVVPFWCRACVLADHDQCEGGLCACPAHRNVPAQAAEQPGSTRTTAQGRPRPGHGAQRDAATPLISGHETAGPGQSIQSPPQPACRCIIGCDHPAPMDLWDCPAHGTLRPEPVTIIDGILRDPAWVPVAGRYVHREIELRREPSWVDELVGRVMAAEFIPTPGGGVLVGIS
jgi:hypothetical protein